MRTLIISVVLIMVAMPIGSLAQNLEQQKDAATRNYLKAQAIIEFSDKQHLKDLEVYFDKRSQLYLELRQNLKEIKRLTKQINELAKQAKDQAEKKRIKDEAEEKRIKDEAEEKRIKDEAEEKQIPSDLEPKQKGEDNEKRKNSKHGEQTIDKEV